jgi:hypothetical protein
MKKVGLVTCFVNNYGACLQAYALQETIKKMSHDVEIVNYTPVKEVQKKNNFQKIIFWLHEKYRCLRYKNYSYSFKSKKYFNRFRKEKLIFSKKFYKDEASLFNQQFYYDAFVVGSDQLWNPVIHGFKNNRAYFLDFAEQELKIAYAPSFGISSFPNKELEDDAKRMLLKFDFLSCREKTGANLVKKITGRKCYAVLDPTLLLSKEEWGQICGDRLIKEDYIFIYRFGESEAQETIIQEFARVAKLPIYSLPMSQNDFNSKYKILKPCGPTEFVNYIKNASFVLTDSFHATVFSINLNVNFGSLLRNQEGETNNMNSRIFDILTKFNLENRLLDDTDSIKNILHSKIDFEKPNKLLKEFRTHDINLLKDALEIK